jgi:hypothetical protein
MAILAGFFSFLLWSPLHAAENCRVLRGPIRIDSAAKVAQMKDVCRVTGGIGIFTRGIEKMSFPLLRSTRVIHVDAPGLKGIQFPALTQVPYLYLRSSELEVFAASKLLYVNGVFMVEGTAMAQLALPALRTVAKLVLEGCSKLEFVLAESLTTIGELYESGNPQLKKESREMLQHLTHVQTPEEKQAALAYRQNLLNWKQSVIAKRSQRPRLPPTGHATYFDTFHNYYQSYRNYWNRWYNDSGPWGYQSFFWTYW